MVIDNAIIGISEKKMRSFPTFAYSFENFHQPHSKYALSIAIHAKQQQNAFDLSHTV